MSEADADSELPRWWQERLRAVGVSLGEPIDRMPRWATWFDTVVAATVVSIGAGFIVIAIWYQRPLALLAVPMLGLGAAAPLARIWWFRHLSVTLSRDGITVARRRESSSVPWSAVELIQGGQYVIRIVYYDGSRRRVLRRPRPWSSFSAPDRFILEQRGRFPRQVRPPPRA